MPTIKDQYEELDQETPDSATPGPDFYSSASPKELLKSLKEINRTDSAPSTAPALRARLILTRAPRLSLPLLEEIFDSKYSSFHDEEKYPDLFLKYLSHHRPKDSVPLDSACRDFLIEYTITRLPPESEAYLDDFFNYLIQEKILSGKNKLVQKTLSDTISAIKNQDSLGGRARESDSIGLDRPDLHLLHYLLAIPDIPLRLLQEIPAALDSAEAHYQFSTELELHSIRTRLSLQKGFSTDYFLASSEPDTLPVHITDQDILSNMAIIARDPRLSLDPIVRQAVLQYQEGIFQCVRAEASKTIIVPWLQNTPISELLDLLDYFKSPELRMIYTDSSIADFLINTPASTLNKFPKHLWTKFLSYEDKRVRLATISQIPSLILKKFPKSLWTKLLSHGDKEVRLAVIAKVSSLKPQPKRLNIYS